MIINILIWVGGFLCSVLYNKAKNEIVKVFFRKTVPQLIRWTDDWHKQNPNYISKIKDDIIDLLEWIIIN